MSREEIAALERAAAVANATMAICKAQSWNSLQTAKAIAVMGTVVVGHDAADKTMLAMFLVGLVRDLDEDVLSSACWQ